MTVTFDVAGRPVAQGSKKGFVNPRTGRVVVVEQMAKRLKVWRRDVAAGARAARVAAGIDPFPGPVAVDVTFRFDRPRNPTYEYPRPNGDVEKLVRSTFDAITDAELWVDDAVVTHLTVAKVYADPVGATIRITDRIP